MKFKLTQKQYNFLCEIYCFFLSLQDNDISQMDGSIEYFYKKSASYKKIQKAFNDKYKEDMECGKCFGWWLAYLFGIYQNSNCNKHTVTLIHFEDGRKLFYKRMGSDNGTWESTSPIRDFMSDCGTGVTNPFSPSNWLKQPHEVIRNMLEKGA